MPIQPAPNEPEPTLKKKIGSDVKVYGNAEVDEELTVTGEITGENGLTVTQGDTQLTDTTVDSLTFSDSQFRDKVIVTDSMGTVVPDDTISITDIHALDGVTSNIQQQIDDEIDERTEQDTVLDGKIDQAVESLQQADETLQSALDTEIENRADADDALQSALDAEIEERTGDVENLEQLISQETERATGAEEALDAKIDTETNRAESAEEGLQSAIESEASERQQADSTEASERQQADNALGSRIGAIEDRIEPWADSSDKLAKISDLDTLESDIDSQLNTKRDKIITDHSNINVAYTQDPSGNESLFNIVSDTTTGGSLVARTNTGTVRTANPTSPNDATTMNYVDTADAILQDNIDAEARDRQDAYDMLNDAIVQEVSARTLAVQNEASTRDSADTQLQNNIDAEADARASGDSTLDDKITQEIADRRYAVQTEASARDSADATLQSNIDTVSNDLSNHEADTNNPHSVTATQVGLGNVVNATMDSTPTDGSPNYVSSGGTYNAIDTVQSNLDSHEADTNNPHVVTKEQVGLGYVQNYPMDLQPSSGSDNYVSSGGVHDAIYNEVSLLQSNIDAETSARDSADTVLQNAIDSESYARQTLQTDLESHISDKNNPHEVTASQVGLGSVVDYPMDVLPTAGSPNYVSSDGVYSAIESEATARGNADTLIQDNLTSHVNDTSNPHSVTATQIGLGNVDNTSDLDKPISTATQTALNGKAPTYHASQNTTYGVGDATNYGHVKMDTTIGDSDRTDTTISESGIRAFVNSSISTNTANYISDNGNPFTDVNDIPTTSPPVTNNDYAVVVVVDAQGNKAYDRYKATVDANGNVTWALEYEINSSEFTAQQWATIDSGMSSSDKTKLDGIQAGAEVNVQSDWNVTDSTSDAFIKNKPTIPVVNNGTLSIQGHGTTASSFTANSSGNVTLNIKGKNGTTVSRTATNEITIESATLSAVATSGDYNDLSNKPTIPTSIDGMSGGTLTSALILTGGDAQSGVANIQLDTNGQITARNTSNTLFGRTGTGGTTLYVGHSAYALTLRGSANRPTYNGNSLALYSDVPDITVKADTNLQNITVGGTRSNGKTIVWNGTSSEWEYGEAGKVDDVKVNGTTVVTSKVANITVPTDLGDLTNNAGYVKSSGVTSITASTGLTGGTITGTGTIKAKLNSETSLGTIGTTSKLYAVGVDSNGQLAVSVPWTDHTYTVNNGTLTMQGNSTSAGTFTANQSGNTTVNWNAGVGIVVTGASGSITTKAKLKSETASTLDSASMGSTASRQYAVGIDKSGYLSVNIPWTDHTYTVNNGKFSVDVASGEIFSFTANQSGNATLYVSGSGGVTVSGGNGTLDIATTEVNDATLTIKRNSSTLATFSANATENKTVNISVPTDITDLSDDSHLLISDFDDLVTHPTTLEGYGITDAVKQVKIGTTAYNPSSGIVTLPAYPTVNNGTLTIKQNGTSKGTFTANQSGNSTVELTDTWTAMVGATSSANGSVGYVNAVPPKDGYNTKYLRADGTWAVPPDHTYTVNNGTLTIKQNGTSMGTFTANQSGNTTIELTNSTYTVNNGTFNIQGDGTTVQSFTANASGTTNMNFVSGTKISLARDTTNKKLTVNHADTTRTDSTSTASPAHGGTFTAVDSVSTDATGHITGVNVKTVTLPSDTDTKVAQILKTDNYNRPLLMSDQVITTTTVDTVGEARRNNSIYANTSTGKITSTLINAMQTGGISRTYELQATGYKAIATLDKDKYWTTNSGQAHLEVLVEYSQVAFGSLATLDVRKGIWRVKIEYSGNDQGVFIESVGDSVGTGNGTLRYLRSYVPKSNAYGPQLTVAQENANVKVYIRVTILSGTEGWVVPATLGGDPGTTNYNQYSAEVGRYNYHWSSLKMATNITGSCDGTSGSTWDSLRNDRYVFGESAVAGSIMAMATDGRMYKLRNGANKVFSLPLHCGRCTGTFTYNGSANPPTLTNYAQIMWNMRSQSYAELTNATMQGTAFTVPTLTAGQYGLPLYVTGTLSGSGFVPDGNIVTAMVNGKTNIQIGRIDRANTALNAVPTLFTITGYGQNAYTLDSNGKLTHIDGKQVYDSGNTDTQNTCGAGNSTSKLYLVGRTAQSTGVSYSNSEVYTSNGILFANSLYVAGGYVSSIATPNTIQNITQVRLETQDTRTGITITGQHDANAEDLFTVRGSAEPIGGGVGKVSAGHFYKGTTEINPVSYQSNLNSGKMIGTITIDGTSTDIYCTTNTDTLVKQTATASTTTTYPLLFSAQSSPTSGTAYEARYSTNCYIKSNELYSNGAKVLTTWTTVNNGTFKVQSDANDIASFTANSSSNVTVNFVSGTGISLARDTTNKKITVNHSNSVTAGTAGTSSATSGSTLAVPYVTYDAQGHITATGTHTHTVTGFLTSHQTIKQDGITGATITRYASCTTGASTQAKTASVTNGTFALETGSRVTVKFSNKNTANSPTLNINSTGAKNIYHNGAQITSGTNKGMLYGACDFVYDGTQWLLVGNYVDTNTNTNTNVYYLPSGTQTFTSSAYIVTTTTPPATITAMSNLDTTAVPSYSKVEAMVLSAKQAMYPVGSVYINASDSTNPATLLGFGTWTQIGEGNVLLAGTTSGTYKVGTSYGSNTTDKVVAHTHTINGVGNHTHEGLYDSDWQQGRAAGNPDGWYDFTDGSDRRYWTSSSRVMNDNNHRFLRTQWGGEHTHTMESAGDATVSIMQQSIAVYMWKRTA